MLYIANAFSLNMLDRSSIGSFIQISNEEATGLVFNNNYESVVGHAETASVFTQQLQVNIKPRRITLRLKDGDLLLVGQYDGPRLQEGATTLPEGATIKWWFVKTTSI